MNNNPNCDTVHEIQVNDTDSSRTIREDDSSIWRNLHEILESSDKGDTHDFDDEGWLPQDFYKQECMIYNKEYAKLKLLNFEDKILNNESIIALFNTEAMRSCISHHLFQKIFDKVDITRMSLWVNTASGTMLDLIDIVLLMLNIHDHTFLCIFIICHKLKQLCIIILDFAQCNKTAVDWDAYGTLFLRYKGKNIVTAMRKGNPCQTSVALVEMPVADKCTEDERKHLVTNETSTITPYQVSMMLLIPVGHLLLWPNTLIEKDQSPFLSIGKLSISILPLLQKVGGRLPDGFITASWNHGDHTKTLKKNTTIGYVREVDYTEKSTIKH